MFSFRLSVSLTYLKSTLIFSITFEPYAIQTSYDIWPVYHMACISVKFNNLLTFMLKIGFSDFVASEGSQPHLGSKIIEDLLLIVILFFSYETT